MGKIEYIDKGLFRYFFNRIKGWYIFVILFSLSIASPLRVIVNRPGMLILELEVTAVRIDNGQILCEPPLMEYRQPGRPQIPYIAEALSNVPANATIQIFTGVERFLPDYEPIVTGPEKAKGIDLVLNSNINNADIFPSRLVYLESTRDLGDQLSSRLVIFPVQYSKHFLTWYDRITIQLTWQPGSGRNIPALLSQQTLDDFRPAQTQRTNRTQASIPAYQFSENIARLTVGTTGWYYLTKQELADSGLAVNNTDPGSFRLWNQDREILLSIEGEEDGQFNQEDLIIFYGEKNPAPSSAPYKNNFYSDENVYWLTWGGEPGIRYVSESAYPNLPSDQVLRPASYRFTQLTERDEYFARLGNMGLHQQWDEFDHFFMTPPINSGTAEDFEIQLPAPKLSNISEFELQMEIQGITSGLHRIQVLLNDRLLTTASWEGQSLFHLTGTDNQDYLSPGSNAVTIINLEEGDGSNNYDQVYLNWSSISYDRLYKVYQDQIQFSRDGNIGVVTQFEIAGFSDSDILVFKEGVSRLHDFIIELDTHDQTYKVILQDYTGSVSPVYHAFEKGRLKQVTRISPAAPLETVLRTGSAEYLVIAPDSFKTILAPLATYHNGEIIDVENIYRQYSGGVLSPYAIKLFLTDVYRNWNPRPQAVLIALQGNWFAWRGSTGRSQSFVPAMKIQTIGFGAASSDFWYTLIEGDDYIPEFTIGRFPVRNKSELEIVVEKTLTYLNRDSELWDNNSLLIGGYESTFKDQSETLIQKVIAEGYFPKRLYIDRYSEGSPFFGNTDTLLTYFRQGLNYVNFFGHGGGAVWGDRSLFNLAHLDKLDNGHKLPFVTSMTCYTGDVTNPNALGRQMVLNENGGAIAWFGSAGVGWIINDFLLLQPILERLFSDRQLSIGEVINLAKLQYLATNSQFPDIAISQIHQFNLTGDPGLVFPKITFSETTIDPVDPEPGEEIRITLEHAITDSVSFQVFDPDFNPLTRYPQKTTRDGVLNLSTDLGNTPGLHTVNLSYLNNNRAYRTSVKYSSSGSLAQIVEISPTTPTTADSIRVKAIVRDRQGVDSVQLWINNIFFGDLRPALGDTFITGSPIAPQSPGTLLFLFCRVVDSQGNVTVGPTTTVEIAQPVEVQPVSLKFFVSDSIYLSAEIRNHTISNGDAFIEFQRRDGEDWTDLGQTTINFMSKMDRPARIAGVFSPGVHTYRVVSNSNDNMSNTDDDTLQIVLETKAFWVTPELGSTYNLESHQSVGLEGVNLEIPAGVAPQAFIIEISGLDTVEAFSQPDLTLTIADTLHPGISIIAAEEVEYNVTWELISPFAGDNLYRFYPEFNTWLPIATHILADTVLQFTAVGTGQYAFFATSDVTPPRVEAAINGQRFLRNAYVSPEPLFSFSAYDENGLDHRPEAIFLRIGNQTLSKELISQVNGKANLLGIQIKPSLTIFDSTLEMAVRDASGNSSDTLLLEFIVSEKLELIDYGNFPNPFKDQTRFAYELTETVDDFSLNIYSVEGRRIRRVNSTSALTDLDPRIGAYHEIIWDGRSDQGDFVSNGVYFYLMRVKKGKTVLESKGKIAKAR